MKLSQAALALAAARADTMYDAECDEVMELSTSLSESLELD